MVQKKETDAKSLSTEKLENVNGGTGGDKRKGHKVVEP